MAFMLNPDAQVVFFSSVFGPSHDVVTVAKALIEKGVKFETAMYTVKATYQGNVSSVNLTTGTTALMKHAAVFDVAEQNKKLINQFVAGLSHTFGLNQEKSQVSVFWDAAMLKPDVIPVIKAIRTVTGLGLGEAKAFAETILTGKTVELQLIVTYPLAVNVLNKVGLSVPGQAAAKSFADAAQKAGEAFQQFGEAVMGVKPVPQVIHLRDAKALGQKVHGTSAGSVYHTIALSEHVRVAARLSKGGSISIRTEWTDSPSAELQKLVDAGVQMKSNYGSIHFDSAGVPLERTIGAFLVGVGIKWKAAVMNGAELVIGDK